MDLINNAPENFGEAPRIAPHTADVKGGRKGGFIFGFIAVIFSLIGFFGCIVFGVGMLKDSAERKKETDFGEYNKFLIAVAAVDPAPFDDITAADMNELVEIAVWSIIGSDLEPDTYDYSSGELAVPVADVEAAFVKYFGNQLVIEHATVTGYGYEFSYNSDDGCYYIPLTTIEPLYTPRVTDSRTKGDTLILTLGMVNANSWKQDSDTGEISRPDPDKYMRVTLRKSGGSSYISALQSSASPETAIVEVFTETPSDETTQLSSES